MLKRLLITAIIPLTVLTAENWQTVPNDPLNVKMTTLENGLKVFMSVNKKKPTVQTYISVKAGSKNDPAETTGLAHYFEHLMFKGTKNFGTIDYEKEKLLLKKIEELFEIFRKTSDPIIRTEIYKQIDKASAEASKLAAPNEYDKMMNYIGASGTNAYTSNEETVYINTIPANRLNTWLDIEFDRFSSPVLRLFHTELETVYEEKNRSLDSDSRRLFTTLLAAVFPNHQYGTQTTLGTINHLKNPSIKNVQNFFDTYYVPNNMAIVLAGDFDPEKALAQIKATFGQLKPKPTPIYNPPKEQLIEKPIVREITGPDSEKVYLAFRFPGIATEDADLLTMMDMILTNGKAGIIDLNINQQQKMLGAFSSPIMFKDYSLLLLGGSPIKGQTLDDVKKLILQQVEELKNGNFADWLPEAVVNNLKLTTIKSYENNNTRGKMIANAYAKGISWKQAIEKNQRLAKITKQQIIDFAKNNLKDNYAVIYKHKGEAPELEKIAKPTITPIEIDQSNQSQFCKNIFSTKPVEIEPEFVNFDKEITKLNLKNGHTLIYKENDENQLFSMKITADIGTDTFPELEIATALFDYAATKDLSAQGIQQFLYQKGCELSVSAGRKTTTLSLTGLSENAIEVAKVVTKMVNKPQVESNILDRLVSRIKKSRENAKTDKNTILWKGMLNHVKYGENNPFRNTLSTDELKQLKTTALTSTLAKVLNSKSNILFYGPQSSKEATELINTVLSEPMTEVATEAKIFKQKPTDGTIYYVNFPGMKQVQVLLASKADPFNPETIAERQIFNEYFGSGMSSIVFQQIREARGLAYSTFATYSTPKRPEENHYFYAFVGTQQDKLFDALNAMTDLIDNMPIEEKRFQTARQGIENGVRTSRLHGESLLSMYDNLRRMGIKDDSRESLYNNLKNCSTNTLSEFHKSKVKSLKRDILILGNLNSDQLGELSKKGTVKTLELNTLFGY